MRIRNKLLLAMTIPVGLLVLQIVLVNLSVRELQRAVTFISDTHRIIEDDFVAADLIGDLRAEIRALPSLYVSGEPPAGEGLAAVSQLMRQLDVRLASIGDSATGHDDASVALSNLNRAAATAREELDKTTASLVSGQTDMDTLLERAVFTDKALAGMLLALDALAVDLRRQLQQAVDRERAIHNRPVIAGIAVGSLTVLMLLAFIWLFIDRYFVGRLTSLSTSMLAIAGGNLRADLPRPSGNDEVAEMARALAVFRDTAIEVEEHNLREVARTRQRLIDAIESISEGFSLYDAEDRLVLSNRRYQNLLHPGADEAIGPGARFQDIIASAARSGEILDAEGRVDDWIAERMSRHAAPQGAFVQRHRPDRWIEVTEHKTAEGGTVAIYADITSRKRADLALREEKHRTELANELVTQKNTMLESLSSQLSKYLSPQVYSSIFSGQQSVEIASKRKKLTVMFSDISGFTETTDALESEELTGLLNTYLTEMSKIALEYGATIDKYIGDAIMLFFGDPDTRGDREDAIACVQMAIAMQRRMRTLRQEWRRLGIEKPFRMRIGINTGYCTVGNFGSEDRMDYTIIGNEVNLAARLQDVAQAGEVVIAHETYALVRDVVQAREAPPRSVKGFDKPIRSYVVQDVDDDTAAASEAFRIDRAGLRITIDPDALSDADREAAIDSIRQVLELLRKPD